MFYSKDALVEMGAMIFGIRLSSNFYVDKMISKLSDAAQVRTSLSDSMAATTASTSASSTTNPHPNTNPAAPTGPPKEPLKAPAAAPAAAVPATAATVVPTLHIKTNQFTIDPPIM